MVMGTGAYSFTVLPEQACHRVDHFLSQQELGLSRSRIQKLIEAGQVRVNEVPIGKASQLLRPGEVIDIIVPEPVESKVLPEKIPLDIVFEDDSIIVVNKPAGMVVHPAAGNYSGTLVNALLYHCRFLSGIGGVTRPGIVHRLDKDTSGLLVVAKTDSAHLSLSEQIKSRSVKRIYKALVYGIPRQAEGDIETRIGRHLVDRKKMSTRTKRGRIAITHYRVEEYFPQVALLEISLQTGRTHQIRVHFSYLGHPVVGDPVYGYKHPPSSMKRFPLLYQAVAQMKRLALHAQTLGFTHPEQKRFLEFTSPLPPDFEYLLHVLKHMKE
jgi:23S rRNA pseudouridine1911/1915/1917 synthase